MKPTLALSILLAMSASSLAQTPTVTEKPAAKPTSATVKAVPQTAAKPSPVNVKAAPAAQKPVVVVAAKPAAQKPAVVAVKPASAKPATISVQPASAKPVAVSVSKAPNTKPVAITAAPKPVAGGHPVAVVAAKPGKSAKPVAVPAKPGVVKAQAAPATKDPFHKKQATAAPAAAPKGTVVAVHDNKPAADEKKDENKKVSAAGRRDPFISPVVNLGAVGSGCTSGKRCLAIDQVALKGVVKSENGMIAVVVNAMDKAYFLRENDPVFNGYVVKITGDSIVFKETFRDKLGKPLTRDVTKTISRPVA